MSPRAINRRQPRSTCALTSHLCGWLVGNGVHQALVLIPCPVRSHAREARSLWPSRRKRTFPMAIMGRFSPPAFGRTPDIRDSPRLIGHTADLSVWVGWRTDVNASNGAGADEFTSKTPS